MGKPTQKRSAAAKAGKCTANNPEPSQREKRVERTLASNMVVLRLLTNR